MSYELPMEPGQWARFLEGYARTGEQTLCLALIAAAHADLSADVGSDTYRQAWRWLTKRDIGKLSLEHCCAIQRMGLSPEGIAEHVRSKFPPPATARRPVRNEIHRPFGWKRRSAA